MVSWEKKTILSEKHEHLIQRADGFQRGISQEIDNLKKDIEKLQAERVEVQKWQKFMMDNWTNEDFGNLFEKHLDELKEKRSKKLHVHQIER